MAAICYTEPNATNSLRSHYATENPNAASNHSPPIYKKLPAATKYLLERTGLISLFYETPSKPVPKPSSLSTNQTSVPKKPPLPDSFMSNHVKTRPKTKAIEQLQPTPPPITNTSMFIATIDKLKKMPKKIHILYFEGKPRGCLHHSNGNFFMNLREFSKEEHQDIEAMCSKHGYKLIKV